MMSFYINTPFSLHLSRELLYMNYSNFCIMQYEYIYIYMDITLIFGNVKKSAHQRSSKQLTLIRKPMNFAGCSMPHCWDTSIWIVLGVKYKSYIYLYVRIHGMLWLQQVKLSATNLPVAPPCESGTGNLGGTFTKAGIIYIYPPGN